MIYAPVGLRNNNLKFATLDWESPACIIYVNSIFASKTPFLLLDQFEHVWW